MNEEDTSSEPDFETLREMLEEAERRKEEQIKKLGGRVSLAITVPVLLLFLWAGIFLVQYNIENPPEERAPTKPLVQTPAPASPELSDEQKDMAQYDLFRDEKDRVVKTNMLGLEKTSDKIVDKEDIHFAMELLNFMHRPANPPPAKH